MGSQMLEGAVKGSAAGYDEVSVEDLIFQSALRVFSGMKASVSENSGGQVQHSAFFASWPPALHA